MQLEMKRQQSREHMQPLSRQHHRLDARAAVIHTAQLTRLAERASTIATSARAGSAADSMRTLLHRGIFTAQQSGPQPLCLHHPEPHFVFRDGHAALAEVE